MDVKQLIEKEKLDKDTKVYLWIWDIMSDIPRAQSAPTSEQGILDTLQVIFTRLNKVNLCLLNHVL